MRILELPRFNPNTTPSSHGHVAAQKIEKVRSFINYEGRLWEVDEFGGRNAPLVMAEVELESEEDVVLVPEWIGEEVSDDFRYYNLSLIDTPYGDWK